MTAFFGRLQGQSLELREGLNIIQSPNESGKSTWCAFLISLLYGINSRERDRAGFIADKNRYAPWSGAMMSGRLECQSGLGELTLTRSTRRQASPLGEFSAVYSGTGDPVPGLSATNCGEALLGISREVFERSAFIRQRGLAISQDAGLERRIASLITSGEEDISYSEAADALKKQLNRRKHNRTGQIPALDAELDDLERQLDEGRALEQRLAAVRLEADTLSAHVTELEAELTLLDQWEAAQHRGILAAAETEARAAEQRAAALREELDRDRVPEGDAIARLRGAIVNLITTRRAVDRARVERDEAMKALLRAEAAVNESPFAGQTVEEARREVAAPPASADWRKGPAVLAIILGTLAAFFLFYKAALFLNGSPWQKSAAMAVLLVGLGITYFFAGCLRRKAIQSAQASALLKRFGTSDLETIQGLADTYCQLYEARDAAQADVNAKTAAADTLYNSLSSNEQAILLEVRRFAPAAFDISTADSLLRTCAVRRKALAEAEAAAREARMRYELQAQQAPAPDILETAEIPAPVRGREAVAAELEQTRGALEASRSAADRLSGQLQAGGDPVVLQAAAADLSGRRTTLEAEYQSILLAMEALEHANTTLQNRFSPALGRRAAEIFSALTDNRYRAVVLDRSFHLSAEPVGDSVYRDAALLSAGAMDQLYLAVRLAICDLVLPPEKPAPIILDDALANFDDERCALALRYLRQMASGRQILLFTCHSREADFFAGDPEVFVQRLTRETGEV